MAYDADNVFAKILRGELPAVKVFEDDATLALMDVMPQAPGHTLVIAKIAAADLFELPDDAAAAVLATVRRLAPAVRDAMAADGIRIFQLNGEAAGQTVFHYHTHILPCYRGQAPAQHSSQMEDTGVLESHAAKIRAALEN